VASATLSVSLGGSDDGLRSLARWLRDEDDLRGQVRLIDGRILPGQMGGVLDVIEVVVTSTTASTVVRSFFGWLNNKRIAERVTIKARAGQGDRLELTFGSADDAKDVLGAINVMLNDGE
jgi:hypothetical protein